MSTRRSPRPPSSPVPASRPRHVEHAYIEPEAGYAEPRRQRRRRDRIRIFACTQTPYMDRDEVASVLGLDPAAGAHRAVGDRRRLRRQARPLGAAAARRRRLEARPAGAPASTTRPESMQSSTKRHPARMRARAGLRRRRPPCRPSTSAATSTPAPMRRGARRSPTACRSTPPDRTACRTLRALTRAVYTNDSVAGAFRGFGVPQSTPARRAADRRARGGAAASIALEFRQRNALAPATPRATGPGAGGQRRPAGLPRRAAAGLARAHVPPRRPSTRDAVAAGAAGAAAPASPACGTASATR